MSAKKTPPTAAAPPAAAAYRFGAFDWLAVAYFASHIPITLLVDAQAVLPDVGVTYPPAVSGLVAWYAAEFADPLMAPRPAGQPDWFKAIVWVEVLLQLPFFFYALAAWLRADNGLRVPLIIYAAHVATTLVPIFGVFAAATAIPADKRAVLAAIYAPYLLMPLAFLYRAVSRPQLFPTKGGKSA